MEKKCEKCGNEDDLTATKFYLYSECTVLVDNKKINDAYGDPSFSITTTKRAKFINPQPQVYYVCKRCAKGRLKKAIAAGFVPPILIILLILLTLLARWTELEFLIIFVAFMAIGVLISPIKIIFYIISLYKDNNLAIGSHIKRHISDEEFIIRDMFKNKKIKLKTGWNHLITKDEKKDISKGIVNYTRTSPTDDDVRNARVIN